MRHKAKQPAQESVRTLSLEEAVALVPETAVPTPAVVRLLKVLATPGAFLALTNGETQELAQLLQAALNNAFATVPKAASKAG
jgi:hypothetical protein